MSIFQVEKDRKLQLQRFSSRFPSNKRVRSSSNRMTQNPPDVSVLYIQNLKL